eukprot:scaffold609_cov234-Pinguiococcus_pyrenoidosus.AAC.6
MQTTEVGAGEAEEGAGMVPGPEAPLPGDGVAPSPEGGPPQAEHPVRHKGGDVESIEEKTLAAPDGSIASPEDVGPDEAESSDAAAPSAEPGGSEKTESGARNEDCAAQEGIVDGPIVDEHPEEVQGDVSTGVTTSDA